MKAECVGVDVMLILGLYEARLLLHLLTKGLKWGSSYADPMHGHGHGVRNYWWLVLITVAIQIASCYIERCVVLWLRVD